MRREFTGRELRVIPTEKPRWAGVWHWLDEVLTPEEFQMLYRIRKERRPGTVKWLGRRLIRDDKLAAMRAIFARIIESKEERRREKEQHEAHFCNFCGERFYVQAESLVDSIIAADQERNRRIRCFDCHEIAKGFEKAFNTGIRSST